MVCGVVFSLIDDQGVWLIAAAQYLKPSALILLCNFTIGDVVSIKHISLLDHLKVEEGNVHCRYEKNLCSLVIAGC